MDFIAIDFETANRNRNSACSMGLAYVENLEIVKTEYFLIKPPTMDFDKVNISIHGITPKDVKDKPYFCEIWPLIKDDFVNTPIIAHNASFDISVLRSALAEYELEVPNIVYYDSMDIASLTGTGKSLVSLSEYYNIALKNHHNALEDAICCAEIVICATKDIYSGIFDKFCKSEHFIVNELNSKSSLAKSKPRKSRKKYCNTIIYSELAPTADTSGINHVFTNKVFVFTGELQSCTRKEAIQEVLNVGGLVKSGVTSKLNYLVVGIQDTAIVGESGTSSKERSAYELIEKGYPIEILDEEKFFKLLKTTS